MLTLFGNEAVLPGNDAVPDSLDLVFLLGRTKRFGGNTPTNEYSVLHHSMLVSLLWLKAYGPHNVHLALLHDCHEAYTGDLPTPVKQAIGREYIDSVQNNIDDRIYRFLDCDTPSHLDDPDMWKHRIKIVDLAALIIEAYYVTNPGHWGHICDRLSLSTNDKLDVRDVIYGSCPIVAQWFTKQYLQVES